LKMPLPNPKRAILAIIRFLKAASSSPSGFVSGVKTILSPLSLSIFYSNEYHSQNVYPCWSTSIRIEEAHTIKVAKRLDIGSNGKVRMDNASCLEVAGSAWIGDRCTVIIHPGGHLSIGDECWLLNDCWIEVGPGMKISIGNRTTLQCRVSLHGEVELGNDCLLAPDVYISSGGHIFDKSRDLTIREQDVLYASSSPVRIGDNCWLGIRSFIS